MKDWYVKVARTACIQTVRLESVIHGNDDMNMMVDINTNININNHLKLSRS